MKRNHWDPEVCSEYLANRLKEGRKEMGYTQSEMAEEMQCSLKSYRKWEKMEGLPCLNYAVHLSCILKHDLAYLVGLRDEKNYDISYIGQETGLSENAIKKISSLSQIEKKMLSSLFEHPGFNNLVKAISMTMAEEKEGQEKIRESYHLYMVWKFLMDIMADLDKKNS